MPSANIPKDERQKRQCKILTTSSVSSVYNSFCQIMEISIRFVQVSLFVRPVVIMLKFHLCQFLVKINISVIILGTFSWYGHRRPQIFAAESPVVVRLDSAARQRPVQIIKWSKSVLITKDDECPGRARGRHTQLTKMTISSRGQHVSTSDGFIHASAQLKYFSPTKIFFRTKNNFALECAAGIM